MTYEKTVAAAKAETGDKKRLAEALATDIPAQHAGRPNGDDDSPRVRDQLLEARQAIIDGGGEPRSVETLAMYRKTALWVIRGVDPPIFEWVDASYTAHDEARRTMTYDEFAALPSQKARDVRASRGTASKDGPPASVAKGWTREQKVEAARELLNDDAVTDEVVKDVRTRARFDRAADRNAEQNETRNAADPGRKRRQQGLQRSSVMVQMSELALSTRTLAELLADTDITDQLADEAENKIAVIDARWAWIKEAFEARSTSLDTGLQALLDGGE